MEKFDAKKHITPIKGKDYIEVKWRLVWFRSENPQGRIDTELLLTEPNIVVKATIYNNDGVNIGSSHGNAPTFNQGSGTWKGREIEKAETAAIGRALAVAGFGTQFAEELDDDDYLADTPVDRKTATNGNSQQGNTPPNVTNMPQRGYTEATDIVVTKTKADGTPYMVIEGITVWSREPFRALGYSPQEIESLAEKGTTRLMSQVIVEWVAGEDGYKKPVSIKRVDTNRICDASGKLIEAAS